MEDGLTRQGQAEVRMRLKDFQFHVLGLWLRILIEGVGLFMMEVTITAFYK
jgi:hypothetical protein